MAHLYGPAVRCKPDVTDLEMTENAFQRLYRSHVTDDVT
jgi:hypothetical protein